MGGAAGPIVDGTDTMSAGVWCEAGSARATIAAAIGAAVTQLRAELPRARSGEDPEGVHQARVATRRLRSDLRTFSPLLDEAWRIRTRAELAWLADALGAVRDADVLGVRLETAFADADVDPRVAARIRSKLDDEARSARRILVDAIDADRTRSLLVRLHRASVDPPTTPSALGSARRRLLPLVRRPWQKLERAVKRLGDEPPMAELHRVRLLAKRSRYASEAVSDVFGRDARRFASALAGIQDVLGEMNDAEVAGEWVAQAERVLDPSSAGAADALITHFHGIAVDHRHGWETAFRRARRRAAWLA